MRNSFFLFFYALLLFSCSGKKSIPKDILPQKKMVSLVWDLLRADEFVPAYILPKDSTLDKEKESTRYYEEIFKLHQTDKATFQKSFTFYQSHPALMKDLLDSLNAKGNADKMDEPRAIHIDSSSLIHKINPKAVEQE